MKSARILGCVAAFLIALPAISLADDGPEIGKPAPAFSLSSYDGKQVKLADYADRVVVLEWFNQDCPVCREFMPTMAKLAHTYAEKGVVWLGVDSTHYQTAEKEASFATEHEIPYPILMDADGQVGRSYGAKTTPHMFVINKGTLVYMGAISDRGDRNYVAEALDAVLAGEGVKLASTKSFGCSVKYANAGGKARRGGRGGARGSRQARPEIGKPAPDFELTGIDGKTYKLSDLQDKIVVLEWFNQDCPVCQKYMPTMRELATTHAEKGVVWLGIDSTHYQTAEKNASFAKEHEIPYPILMDTDGRVGHTYGAKTTPHMFVINKGTLAYMGGIDDRGSRNYVAEALESLEAGKDVPLDTSKPFGCSVKYKPD